MNNLLSYSCPAFRGVYFFRVVSLIDVNDATGRFQPPSPGELAAFRDALRRHLHMPVARRYSGGADIHAACGMLAGE